MSKTREARLESALEFLLEVMEYPPDSNCSCHISPPCGDCVNWSDLREAISAATDALKPDETPCE